MLIDDERTDDVKARKADRPDPNPKPAEADPKSESSPEPPKPSPLTLVRKHPAFSLAGAVVLLAAIIAGILWWLHARHFETTDDAFVDARQFSISPKVNGYVTQVAVTDNQLVAERTLLIRIDDSDYQIALKQAKAQVDEAQAAIGNVDAQIAAQQAQVTEAQAQVKQAQASLEFAQQEAGRAQELVERGAGTVQRSQQTESSLQQQQAGLAQAQAGVSAAQRQIASLQAQRNSAVANLAQTKAVEDQAELNVSYTTLMASQGGRVTKLSAAKGQYVQVGQSLTMFVPTDIWITANFKETQITDMKPGQPVDVRVDAYPGRTFRGHVDSVQQGSGTAFSLLPAENATGNYVKVVQRIPVKIVFDEHPGDLVLGPGMSVVPKVRVR